MCERTVVHGANTKGSCPDAPTDNDIHNDLLTPSEESITKLLCHVMDKKDIIPFKLEHDRELECFYVDPNDIKDLIIGKQWLNVGILEIWCT